MKHRVFTCALIVTFLFIGCNNAANQKYGDIALHWSEYMPRSFKNIPGITEEEIRAIEELQKQENVFIFGMPLSTEAFSDSEGKINGFSALFSEWLSAYFGINVQPELFNWQDLIAGLDSGRIAFTGELTPTEERRKAYIMSNPIASRMIKKYRIEGSAPLEEITAERRPRFGFIEGTTTINTVISEMERGTYDIVLLSDVSLVYDALKSGRIDVFYYSGTIEANFVKHRDLISDHFYPLTYRPVSLTTKNPELKPIISAVDKILENRGIRFINMLYNRGDLEFKRHKLFSMLTSEEKEFLFYNRDIKFVAEYYNYPVSFYNTHDDEWQGIVFDILPRIKELTGLNFVLANDHHTEWPKLLEMLESGEVSMNAELIRSRDREGRFLWPNNYNLSDNFTLVSRSNFPDKNINEIMEVRVGLVWGSVYSEVFNRWFPDHPYTIEYISSNAAFQALERGEIDMVMSSQHRLLAITHYNEFVGYKANIIFDYTSESRFGFNLNEAILCSIVDKALDMIDSRAIADQWMRKTYDYRAKVAEAQRPWLLGSSVLLLFVLTLLIVILVRNRREGIKLEALVQERTTKLNRYQKELEQALEIARSANNSKSIFLANMSHEIRTPMNSIMGFSELALDGEVSEKTRDYLLNIQTNADWLLQIINDILDISKIESGKMELEEIPFDMHELFASCRTLVMPKAVEKGILLHFYAEPSFGKKPVGDPTRLRQVFVNLLSNAVKFTNSGMVKLVSDITSIDERTIAMHFEIKDSGIGMTPEQIAIIFDPFTQAETGTTRKYGGSGLGLAISKTIIEMMGGKLTVESVPGVGSKFSFGLIFPIVAVTEEEILQNSVTFNEIEKPTFDAEILLCEDNLMNQQVICEHLSRIGIKTVVADNGKIGVDQVKARMKEGERQFNLIFMDMHMPIMDGLEASVEIMKLNTGIPIIAMTANVMAEDREVYKTTGMSDCLGKPFTSQELWRCLLKFIIPVDTREGKSDSPKEVILEYDMEFQKSLKKYFVKNNRKKYDEIVFAIERGDIKLAHRLVHTLKSNAGQIGKAELQAAAVKIEQLLRNDRNMVTQDLMDKLEKQLTSALTEFAPLLEENTQIKDAHSDAVGVDMVAIRKTFEKLEPMLKMGNPECLKLANILREIAGGDEQCVQLIQHMEDFEFEAALSLLSLIKEKLGIN